MGVLDDTGNSGHDEKDVADECDANCDTYSLVTTPSCVCNVSAEKRNNVDPAYVSLRPAQPTGTRTTYQKVLKVPIPVEAR